MPSYSGVWTLTAQYQAKGAGNWPLPPAIGLFAGGETSGGYTSVITQVSILTLGNSTAFGNLTAGYTTGAGAGSTTRGLFGFGYLPPATNAIEYVTFATAGNATAFGQLTVAKYGKAGCNSGTRALFAGGEGSGATTSSVIDYVTIATTGNATFFGYLTTPKYYFAACSSPTRGVFAAGRNSGSSNTIDMQYVTIASTGNATYFGDLATYTAFIGAASSSTRGVFAKIGSNTIDYITIATTGNASTFGQLTFNSGSNYGPAGASSPLYAVFAGGSPIGGGSYANAIQYLTFSTLSNTTYFGDLSYAAIDLAGCSNGNGGL